MDIGTKNNEREYCLVILYHKSVNEDCIMGILHAWDEKYLVRSRQEIQHSIKLTVDLHLKTVQPEVIQYLSSLDGVERVLLVAESSLNVA